MRTSKPLSPVTYNTEEFLLATLQSLIDEDLITEWHYIKHKADVDCNKDHIHLYLLPTKPVDVPNSPFCTRFNEFDPSKPDKPLKPIWLNPNCPSKANTCSSDPDLVDYWTHDPEYLAEKGLTRNITYKRDDIVSSSEEARERLFSAQRPPKKPNKSSDVCMLLLGGYDPVEVVIKFGFSSALVNACVRTVQTCYGKDYFEKRDTRELRAENRELVSSIIKEAADNIEQKQNSGLAKEVWLNCPWKE